MSGKNPNNVDSKLIALVPGANSTVVPQKRGTNGNSSIVGENSRAVANEVLDAFTKTENARERREKPLLITLIVLMTIQVVAFNIIIAGAGIYIFSLKDTSVLQLFFDVFEVLYWSNGGRVNRNICFCDQGYFYFWSLEIGRDANG